MEWPRKLAANLSDLIIEFYSSHGDMNDVRRRIVVAMVVDSKVYWAGSDSSWAFALVLQC